MLIGYGIITCCHTNCGISFAVPSRWQEKKRNDHTGFYCPNGHIQAYKGRSEEEKLRQERDRLKQNEAYLEDRLRDKDKQISAQKGQVTKIKNRIAAGVCPCCNRTFGNLARHMAHKHKEYRTEKAA